MVPLRLYAYDDAGRVIAEAASHQCRTFSALHLYRYDEANRLAEHVRFQSRRLFRRELFYGGHGRLDAVRGGGANDLLSEVVINA